MPDRKCSRCAKKVSDHNGVIRGGVFKMPSPNHASRPDHKDHYSRLYGHIYDPNKDYFFCAECVLNALMQN